MPAVQQDLFKITLTSTAILVGVPPAADTRFSAGIIVQSEHVTCTQRRIAGEGGDHGDGESGINSAYVGPH